MGLLCSIPRPAEDCRSEGMSTQWQDKHASSRHKAQLPSSSGTLASCWAFCFTQAWSPYSYFWSLRSNWTLQAFLHLLQKSPLPSVVQKFSLHSKEAQTGKL